jgi:hypothetical protein
MVVTLSDMNMEPLPVRRFSKAVGNRVALKGVTNIEVIK